MTKASITLQWMSTYVHEHNGRFVVARHDRDDGLYYAPQRAAVQRVTGTFITFGALSYVADDAYSYKRKAAAVRKATELFFF